MTIHNLKIDVAPFNDLLTGTKTSEVRNDDRGFEVSDTVRLTCTDGRTTDRTISHIQRGYGLPEGICVLSYNRAVPDLVRYDKEFESMFEREDGKYVLHSQAAEIIAAKDKGIERLSQQCHDLNEELQGAYDRAEAAEAKLAQYEAQEPVAWVDENGMAAFTLGGISTVHTQFETSKSERFCFPVYASPAPAADLKAENAKLLALVQNITKFDIGSPEHFRAVYDARAALNVEAGNDKG